MTDREASLVSTGFFIWVIVSSLLHCDERVGHLLKAFVLVASYRGGNQSALRQDYPYTDSAAIAGILWLLVQYSPLNSPPEPSSGHTPATVSSSHTYPYSCTLVPARCRNTPASFGTEESP